MKHKEQRKSHPRAATGLIVSSALLAGGIAAQDLGPQLAVAADNKVISGHACEPAGDDLYTDRSNPRYLENLAGYQPYMCMVVRDDTTGELDYVRVRVDNGNSAMDVSPLQCTVHSVSVSGGSHDAQMELTSTPGVQTLEFDLNGFTEFDHGHYVIECLLGPGDRIISYRTKET